MDEELRNLSDTETMDISIHENDNEEGDSETESESENEEGDSRGAASRSMMNEVYFYLTDERKYMYQGDDTYKRSLRRKAKNFTVKEGRFFITVYIN